MTVNTEYQKLLALTVNFYPSTVMAAFMFTLAFLNEKDKKVHSVKHGFLTFTKVKLCKRPEINTPCPSAPVAIQFWNGDSNGIPGFEGENINKIKLIRLRRFSTGELSKNYASKKQRFHKTCCYFGQDPKWKRSISQSNFHGQLPKILMTCLCFCVLRNVPAT